MFNTSAKGWNQTAKIFCGFSLVFVFVGAGFGIYRWVYLQDAVATQATITNLIERDNDEGDKMYAPVYVFEDMNGNIVKVISSTASWPPVGEIGDPIEILYLPNDPQRSIQNRFFSKWGFSVIAGGLGTFYFLVFGLVAYFTGRHIRKANKPIEATA